MEISRSCPGAWYLNSPTSQVGHGELLAGILVVFLMQWVSLTAAALLAHTQCHPVAAAGALYATNIGALHPLGMEGWRFAFLSVAVVSATIGVLTYLFGHDPRFEDDRLAI